MCGICGFCGFRDDPLLERMCSLLKHRGPDQYGTYVSGDISLGHRRLSIIDLSERGKEPMTNEDGTLHLIFNGEIYNFRELRLELEKKGHIFTSNTDAEVILHIYEERGIQCVEELRGMFAFAIWDIKNNRLILCRDRLGIKPLYYWWDGSNFLFASELKALLASNRIPKEISEESYHSYLAFQYVPGEETIIKNIRRLPPGSLLVLEDGSLTVRKYWTIQDAAQTRDTLDEKTAKERLEALLVSSVKARLISDVPLGVLLSGGIDSSSITALMAELSTDPIKTFTVGFGEKGDELEYARLVADKFGTDHHEFIVRPDNLLEKLERIVWYLDEPIADGGATATFLVSEVLKEQVKVVMVGEGADELFCGYSWHKLASPYLGIIPKNFKRRLYYYLNTFYRGWANSKVIYSQFEQLFERDDHNADFLSEMSHFEILNSLPNCLLMKVDRMSMAHSLEARVPFLDHKVVEFAVALQSAYKLKDFTGKHILRELMKDRLPRTIVERKKRGFLLPLNKWFEGKLRDYSRSMVLAGGSFSESILGRDTLLKLFDSRYGLKALENKIIVWRLLIFELWFNQYIRKSGGISPV